MTPGPARVLGVTAGVTVALGAGWILQGWWWLAALGAAVGAVGAVTERQVTHLQALGTLALAGGAAATDRRWLIVVLVVGLVASVETGAAADRVTVVRPEVPDLGQVLPATAGAALVAAVVLAIGGATTTMATLAGVAGALAAMAAMRVIAR